MRIGQTRQGKKQGKETVGRKGKKRMEDRNEFRAGKELTEGKRLKIGKAVNSRKKSVGKRKKEKKGLKKKIQESR